MAEHTIFENLQRLKDSKSAIGNAIITKGGTVGATDGLEEFAADIMSIKNDMTSIDITENGTYYSGEETVVTSSTFPVVINDSNGTPVRHAVINGNTVQNGTPTPDSPIMPEGTGERTGNLFDINATPTKYSQSTTVTVDGRTLTISGSWYIYYKIDVVPNTDYYVSWTINYSEMQGRGSIAILTASGQTIKEQNVQPFSFNSGENQRIQLYIYSGSNEPATVILSNIMFNAGSTALPYEPYGIKIPISSASITTPVYLGEVETTRRVKKLVLTGQEETIKFYSGSANGVGAYLNCPDMLSNSRSNGFSTHFLPQITPNGSQIDGVTFGTSNTYVFFTFSSDTATALNLTDLNSIKAWFQHQYSAGTPVTVWYVLANEETTVVNEPLMKIGDYVDSLSVDVELPLLQNTKNNIDVNTTLKPSSASFTYNKLSEYIGYNEINVDVSNTYTAEDEGKVVNNATLVPQTAMSTEITANDTYDTTLYNSIVVNVPSAPTPTPSVKSGVAFYDYDGTIVQSYSANDFANLSELPTNPTHEGLIAQGWNWSLADAKAYVANYGSLNIGQMYTTSDGKTRLYISLPDGRTSPILQLYLNDNSELDIDWGDESTHSTFTTTSSEYKSERHEYSTSGDYVIAITVVSGGFELQSSSTNVSSILWNGNNLLNSPDKVYNNAIKKIEIGDGVTNIGVKAFYNCSSLSLMTIPDNVTTIGDNAFDSCYSLSSIIVPDAVTSIGSTSFSNCYSLSSITIPNGVTSIGDDTFSGCKSLSSLTIPDGVTSIGDSVFSGCSSLSSVTISDKVTSIGKRVFGNCSSLSSITIPDSVTTIGGSTFSGCSSLSLITIPNGVTSIDSSAFSGCSSLSFITIPNTVTSIGMSAFVNCSSLSSIIIPNSVKSISNTIFSGCSSLSSITIPNGVTSIGATAFSNCAYMSYIKFEPTTPPTVSNANAWTGLSTSTKILVPSGTLATYKSASKYPNPSTYTYEEY